jgi:hypothetical protein
MKISSEDFRVTGKVKLSERPTVVKAFFDSKEEYQDILDKQVIELSEL